MKEQDIRRTIREVCEALDARRAKLGPLAMTAAMAMALGCSGSIITTTNTTQSDAADSETEVTSDAPAMHYAAQFDAADSATTVAPPFDAYGVPFDALPPTDSAWVYDDTCVYGCDSYLFHPDDISDTSDSDAADGDAPFDAGGAAKYAVVFDSDTSENEGG